MIVRLTETHTVNLDYVTEITRQNVNGKLGCEVVIQRPNLCEGGGDGKLIHISFGSEAERDEFERLVCTLQNHGSADILLERGNGHAWLVLEGKSTVLDTAELLVELREGGDEG